MKIALLDNDAEFLAELSEHIHTILSEHGSMTHTVSAFLRAEEFLAAWHTGAFDFVILDVLLDGMTGIDVARKLRETDRAVRIAFCASSNNYAAESYEVCAHYYVRKPIGKSRIAELLRRLGIEQFERSYTIALPDGHLVKPRSILYTEYENHVVTLFMKDGEPHKVRSSHSEIEALLVPLGYFFSPYKGVLVNLSEAVSISNTAFTLSGGDVLPIARRKYKEAKTAYLKCKATTSIDAL